MDKSVKIKGLDAPVSQLIIGTAWFDPEQQDSIEQLLDAYVEAGGNMLDTGRFYNGSKAEDVIIEWLDKRNLRDKLLFTSKACHHYVNENNEHFPEINRVKPEYITEDLNFSLQHLGIDHFDVFMMHRDNHKVPVGPLIDTLEMHHKEGKIRAYGLSNWNLARVKEAIEYANSKGYQGISTVSPSYSLATVGKSRWEGAEYVGDDYALAFKGTDVTILTWGSQGGGFFTETWTRENAPDGYVECYFNKENEEKLKRAKELAEKYNAVPVNIALAYVLCQGLPIAAIIGPRNKEQFMSTLKVLDIKLTPSEIEYLSLRSDKY